MQQGVIGAQQVHEINEMIDVQNREVENEPFVQRTREFFSLIKEAFGRDSQSFGTFKRLCNESSRIGNTDEPLLQIYEVVREKEELALIFIDLVPEGFLQRKMPDLEKQLVRKFDALVRQQTDQRCH